MNSPSANSFAVILAGGSGTRFWPWSRKGRPKQLLPLDRGRSLLRAAAARLAPLVSWERILVVTNRHQAAAVTKELPELPQGNLWVEPEGRDTAPSIGWVTWKLLASAPEARVVVVPADHLVGDEVAFRHTLQVALEVAEETHGLVTVGLQPTRPETGFGYLELGQPAAARNGVGVFRVVRFWEKPSREKAEEFLACGNFRWNGGIFAFSLQVMAEAIATFLPELAHGLDQWRQWSEELGEEAALARVYPLLPRISIDYGVMEKAQNLWAVEGNFPWSDVGSFAALAEAWPAREAGVTYGPVETLGVGNSVLVSTGPLVAAVGVENLVVVATEDAVLVVPRDQCQRVRELVERLKAQGREELL